MKDESDHSKGRFPIINLTMIEVVLLLVFILMIGVRFFIQERGEAEAEVADCRELKKSVEDGLRKAGISFEKLPEYFTKLVNVNTLDDQRRKLVEDLQRLRRELNVAKSEFDSFRSDVKSKQDVVGEFRRSEKRVADLEAMMAREKGKYDERGGIDKPPCWCDDKGKPEYVLSITISQQGFQVVPLWQEGRASEKVIQKVPRSLFGRVLQEEDFRVLCEPFYASSLENDCRYFVIVNDRTESKSVYKKRLATVENYFYKLLKE